MPAQRLRMRKVRRWSVACQTCGVASSGRSGAGLNPDYRLSLEIRNFEAIYDAAGMPVATRVGTPVATVPLPCFTVGSASAAGVLPAMMAAGSG